MQILNRTNSPALSTFLIGLLFVCLSNVVLSQSKADKIEKLISTYSEYDKFNGSVLVSEQGKVIFEKGYGFANKEWDIPNAPNTKHRLASVTKQFTTMLIVQLVAESKLDLNAPITTYLPEYPKKTGDSISIHHLLTHTSGIPNFTSFRNYQDLMKDSYKPNEIIDLFADSTLHFKPGTKFRYSNSGYALLGSIIEKVSGMSFEKVLNEKILSPLNMKNTGFDNHKTVLKNRASGYYNRGGKFENANFIDLSLALGAGSLYSTVEDMYLWDQALYTEKLLPKKYLELIFDKHISAWGAHYGYGWMISQISIGNTSNKLKTLEHDGFVNGFSSLIIRIPETESCIIFLNNTGGAPLRDMARAVTGILQGETFDFPKRSIAQSVSKVIEEKGINSGFSFYNEIKDSDNYYLSENEMNLAAYDLLQSEKYEDAAKFFKFNIDIFPHSFNVYDSYAEALLKLGKKPLAIENYKKSLDLNPDNENGRKMLEELGVEVNIPRKEDLFFLEANSSWRKEIFRFPINFAPGINYKGAEDARFPEGWEHVDNANFWSYVFGWHVILEKEVSTKDLEENLQLYFDGLMRINDKSKDENVPNTIATIDKINNSLYKGKVITYDNFFNKKSMTLNVIAETKYCPENKSVILFKFSPMPFESNVWQKLDEIKTPSNICDF